MRYKILGWSMCAVLVSIAIAAPLYDDPPLPWGAGWDHVMFACVFVIVVSLGLSDMVERSHWRVD